jgi:choline dehydrogenase-like flavoprotein
MRYAAPFIVLTRDRSEGRIDARTGSVDYRSAEADAKMLRAGMLAAARAHFAAGAERVTFATSPTLEATPDELPGLEAILPRLRMGPNWIGLWSAHQMGSCRIGRTPEMGVCDGQGQVYGCRGVWIADGSLFPSASGVNPMETIMALACRTARAVLSEV